MIEADVSRDVFWDSTDVSRDISGDVCLWINEPFVSAYEWVVAGANRCDTVCQGQYMQPVTSGPHSDANTNDYWVCSANPHNRGYRAGLNQAPNWTNGCQVTYNHSDMMATPQKCLCTRNPVQPSWIEAESGASCQETCIADGKMALSSGKDPTEGHNNQTYDVCSAVLGAWGWRPGFTVSGWANNQCVVPPQDFQDVKRCLCVPQEWKHTGIMTEETSKDSGNLLTTTQHMEKAPEHEATKDIVTTSSLGLPEVSEMTTSPDHSNMDNVTVIETSGFPQGEAGSSTVPEETLRSSVKPESSETAGVTTKMFDSSLTGGTFSEMVSSSLKTAPPTTSTTAKMLDSNLAGGTFSELLSSYLKTEPPTTNTTAKMLDSNLTKDTVSKLTSNSSITLQTIKITITTMVNSNLTEGTHSELSSSHPTTPSTTKTTTTTTTTTSPGSTTPSFPLSETEQVVATVIQTLGCTFILVCLAVTIGVYLFLRDFSYERFLHMNMEVALFIGHILVLTMRDKTTNPVPCKLAGAGFQFFFLASFSFMMLEALQAYTIATSVIPFGGYCSRLQYFIVGWGIPSIITVVSVALMHKDYISLWSCWLNLGSSVHYATVCPVLIMSAATIVMAEATGMGNYPPLPNRDRNQATAAVANSKALFLIVPLSTASWFVGMFAVYYQNIALYSVVHGLNVALGISIFVFHSLGNPKVHAIFKKFLPKCC